MLVYYLALNHHKAYLLLFDATMVSLAILYSQGLDCPITPSPFEAAMANTSNRVKLFASEQHGKYFAVNSYLAKNRSNLKMFIHYIKMFINSSILLNI